MKLNDLNETKIRKFSGDTIYDRGYGYYESGMVYELDYDLNTDSLQAMVSGNYGDYEVDITSEQGRIDADCDCPYDGYPCKHIVAVLLTYIHKQNKYIEEALEHKKETSSLKVKIKALPKDELAELILSCASQYTDFKRELLVRFEPDNKITLTTIVKQVEKAFPSALSHNYYPSNITRQLKAIMKSVEDASDTIKAEVYWAVTDRILTELNEYGMDEESLEDVAINALESLAECLVNNRSLRQRKKEIIEKLMEYYTWGNCGIKDYIYDSVYQLCSDKSDYQILTESLEVHIKKASFKSYYQNLLADLYNAIGDQTSRLKTLERNLQYGSDYWRLAEYWIEQGDNNKALQIMHEGLENGEGRKAELYLYFQEHYQKQNDYDQIFNLLKRKIQNHDLDNHDFKSDATYRCLWQHYTSKNDYQMQEKLLKLRLDKEIDLDLYKGAEKTLHQTHWSEFQDKILTQLKDAIPKNQRAWSWRWSYPSKDEETLAEIYHYKKDFKNLLETIKNHYSLLDKYKKKLLPLFPEDYLEKYCDIIDNFIAVRGRNNYNIAAGYAKKVKRIFQNILKEPEKWQRYIQKLRGTHKNLPAMQDEFAGL